MAKVPQPQLTSQQAWIAYSWYTTASGRHGRGQTLGVFVATKDAERHFGTTFQTIDDEFSTLMHGELDFGNGVNYVVRLEPVRLYTQEEPNG